MIRVAPFKECGITRSRPLGELVSGVATLDHGGSERSRQGRNTVRHGHTTRDPRRRKFLGSFADAEDDRLEAMEKEKGCVKRARGGQDLHAAGN